MPEINKKNIIIAIILAIIIILIIVINMPKAEESEQEWLIESNTQEIEQTKESKIVVHITGQVTNNGIVEINEGERIADAIEKAGGLTPEADITKVNLAYILTDGQKIYIPSIHEKGEEEYVTQSSGENVIIENNLSKKEEKKININTANEQQLQELQGIGESMAKRIVEYRKANGKFTSTEDLKKVSGIGEAKYNKIKDYICIK